MKNLEQIQEEIAKENGIPAKYLFAQPDNEGILKRSMRDMKNIKQIQEESRKAIIMANNPEAKSYADAIDIMYPVHLYDYDLECNSYKEYNVEKHCYEINVNTVLENEIAPRIPLALERILIALNGQVLITHIKDSIFHISIYGNLIAWDLTKKTLEKQTEETQREIHKLVKV